MPNQGNIESQYDPASRHTVLIYRNTLGTLRDLQYTPFGDTAATGSPSTNPFQFTVRDDNGTELYYSRPRYYDAAHKHLAVPESEM